jgi:hypothetical protein
VIRCLRCGQEFDDATPLVVCDRCGERLPRSPAAPSTADVTVALPPLPSPLTTIAFPLPATPASADPAPAGPALDAHHLDAIAEYEKDKALVAVIGFGGGGKTFLINRLRDVLPRGPWKCAPPPAREIPLSPEGLELTRLVRTGRGRVPGFTLIDCAGESLVQALDGQRENASLDGTPARSYLAALALARGYILVIRAEDLLDAGGPAAARLAPVMDGFYDIVHAIVVAKQRLRTEAARTLLERGIPRAEIDAAFDSPRTRCAEPLAVVFSQADRLEQRGDSGDVYDLDPYLFAVRHAPKLWRAIERSFVHYRFDFLSAFYRHAAASPAENIRPRYDLPSYGAEETFGWLARALDPGPPWTWPLRWGRGQLPTRYAVRLRKLVEPAFRRELGR